MLYSLLCVALRVVLGGEVAAVADAGLGLVFRRLPEAFIRRVPDKLLENFVCIFVVDLEAGLEGQEVRDVREAGMRHLRLPGVDGRHRRACDLLGRVC